MVLCTVCVYELPGCGSRPRLRTAAETKGRLCFSRERRESSCKTSAFNTNGGGDEGESGRDEGMDLSILEPVGG